MNRTIAQELFDLERHLKKIRKIINSGDPIKWQSTLNFLPLKLKSQFGDAWEHMFYKHYLIIRQLEQDKFGTIWCDKIFIYCNERRLTTMRQFNTTSKQTLPNSFNDLQPKQLAKACKYLPSTSDWLTEYQTKTIKEYIWRNINIPIDWIVKYPDYFGLFTDIQLEIGYYFVRSKMGNNHSLEQQIRDFFPHLTIGDGKLDGLIEAIAEFDKYNILPIELSPETLSVLSFGFSFLPNVILLTIMYTHWECYLQSIPWTDLPTYDILNTTDEETFKFILNQAQSPLNRVLIPLALYHATVRCNKENISMITRIIHYPTYLNVLIPFPKHMRGERQHLINELLKNSYQISNAPMDHFMHLFEDENVIKAFLDSCFTYNSTHRTIEVDCRFTLQYYSDNTLVPGYLNLLFMVRNFADTVNTHPFFLLWKQIAILEYPHITKRQNAINFYIDMVRDYPEHTIQLPIRYLIIDIPARRVYKNDFSHKTRLLLSCQLINKMIIICNSK